jgi:hypothetical protein
MTSQNVKRYNVYLRPIFRKFRVKMGRRVFLRKKLNLHSFDNGNGRHACHKSSTSRAGSSRLSFTRTRNVTASRPSTMRWS